MGERDDDQLSTAGSCNLYAGTSRFSVVGNVATFEDRQWSSFDVPGEIAVGAGAGTRTGGARDRRCRCAPDGPGRAIEPSQRTLDLLAPQLMVAPASFAAPGS